VVIAKELEWMREYIEAIAHLLPEVKYLRRVSSIKANKRFIQRIHGICWKYADGKNYKIGLYVSKSKVDSLEPLRVKLTKYSTIDLLCTLAHELAHLRHWYHTTEHKALECAITMVFMNMLKNDGYTSEEEEAKLVKGFRIA
jgi:hypothetical protein